MGDIGVKYTRRADDTGWLRVTLNGSGQAAYLCEYTRVQLLRETGGRQYFTIADGNSEHVGKEASLTTANAATYLSDVGPMGPAIVQVSPFGAPIIENSPFKGPLKQQWATVSVAGVHALVSLNSVWDESFTPIPRGKHMIMAPDQSHANINTGPYRAKTPGMRCTDVWFPIQLEGMSGNSSRYIHPGHVSEGCVTVHELTQWTAVYDYLISSRIAGPDGRFVGFLIVSA
ncbi:hypothetical protein J421_5969 (plasmid) [Gemmatirosa kalamazoonensis]|uniref:DUF2778 domain-containing protein n=1 Tax=Gemmatirosa kalamazoonensis TaxID=861299 RepID=W0RR86_9BACT|nr:hypothetical protein [Gemmatirosa kalamazoonensis]AHG93504.1 hypothetical protein J421_5969 [Gemmatirosa kalamazoonensis]